MHSKTLLICYYAAGLALAAPAADSRGKPSVGMTGSAGLHVNPRYVPNAGRAHRKASAKFGRKRHIPETVRAKYATAYRDFGFDSYAAAINSIGRGRPSRRNIKRGEQMQACGCASPEAARSSGRGSKASGSSIANPADPVDGEFLTPITVGGQTFNVQIDTGSSDFWLFSTFLAKNETEGHTRIFDPKKSETFKTVKGATWFIQYGEGFAGGEVVGTDVTDVGGGLVVEDQMVELANTVSVDLTEDPESDGIMGFAFDMNNEVKPKKAKTFFSNLLPKLDKGLVAADFNSQANGTFDFGFIDSKKFKGDIQWVDLITKNGDWEFPAPEVTFGDMTIKNKGSGTAIADTGTSLLTMPGKMADEFYKQVEGAVFDEQEGVFFFPCNSTLPDVTLSVGEHKATIAGPNLIFEKDLDDRPGMCTGAVEGFDDDGLMIYGDTFMKSFYSVFDLENKKFGFAPKAKNGAQAAETAPSQMQEGPNAEESSPSTVESVYAAQETSPTAAESGYASVESSPSAVETGYTGGEPSSMGSGYAAMESSPSKSGSQNSCE